MNNVHYRRTNESVKGILIGLDVKEEDKIFAITGSGDFSFAVVGAGVNVCSYDRDLNQVSFVDYRDRALLEGDFERFRLTEELGPNRNRYFDNPEVVRAIRKETWRMQNRYCPDFTQEDFSRFNKFFFSNALTYVLTGVDSRKNPNPNLNETIKMRLIETLRRVPPRSLVYISQTPSFFNVPGLSGQKVNSITLNQDILEEVNMSLEPELTNSARLQQSEDMLTDRAIIPWTPCVFRKN